MRFLVVFLGSMLLFTSCKNDSKQLDKANIEEHSLVQNLNNPSQGNSQLPRLFSNGEHLYFSWVERKDSLDVLSYAGYSPDGPLKEWWNETEVTSGGDWFTNWADFPAIAENNGNILTSFLQKSAIGTYTYDVKLNLFQAQSHLIKKNFILHNDGTKSEHGFVSMLPWAKDQFFVTWLDGRNTIGGHDNHESHGAGGAMTLRGAFVAVDGEIVNDTELDSRVCDCCQTSATLTANGLVVAYRDRSDDEVRDISVIRYHRHGWSEPIKIGNDQWRIVGCPVNGPAIDAIENTVALAWFTAAREEGEVQVAFSQDGAKTFEQPIRIDAGNATGRVDIAMLSVTEAAVLWMEPQGEEEVIQLMKVNSEGVKGNPITISKTSPERASGFPQLEKVGGQLFVAWTVVEEDGSRIEMARLRLADM